MTSIIVRKNDFMYDLKSTTRSFSEAYQQQQNATTIFKQKYPQPKQKERYTYRIRNYAHKIDEVRRKIKMKKRSNYFFLKVSAIECTKLIVSTFLSMEES
jgi:hypothetical protein